ncbi:hypothetical protein VSR01_30105 [Actinacidiphila sp. DG2A-62]|uniref:hypothetical protein n=1 Tax=Actinacidiphila sp. DG2A-62 TaxID=3108821 RepID=UPI002DB81B8A|nr:hypothetical protein [Actinacidiphila sp. DG2A-62]MEC3997521.1 hypothetical protein [Actinacidiphila sp. DG2A-62]
MSSTRSGSFSPARSSIWRRIAAAEKRSVASGRGGADTAGVAPSSEPSAELSGEMSAEPVA